LLSAERIVTELRVVPVFETRFRGVFCSCPLSRRIWKLFSRKGPKNTIRYMTIMMISLMVSLIRFSLDEIYGGSMYSYSFYFFYSTYSSSYLISWAYSSLMGMEFSWR